MCFTLLGFGTASYWRVHTSVAKLNPRACLSTWVYVCLLPGYNTRLIADGLKLLGEVSWTTCGVEQGHGSVAVIHKLHPEYCVPTIAARSLLHQARSLFASPSQALPIPRAQKRLEKMLGSQPERIGGKHVFLADAYAAAKSVLQRSGQKLSNELRLEIMRKHGAEYNKLPLEKRMQYEELASNKAQTNRGELNEDIAHTMAAIGLGKRREREEQLANGMPQCLLSQVPFSDDEIAAMVVDWTSDDFNLHRVVALRDAAVVAPSAPSLREQAALMSQPGAYIPAANPSGPIRDWVRLVCAHRKHFHGCAILGSVGGQPKAFALLYAMQRPLLVALCPMDLLRKTMPVFKDMSLEQQKAFLQDSFLHEFVSRVGTSVHHHGVAFDDEEGLQVIRDLVLLPGHRVCSDSSAVPLEVFCASLPKASATKASSSTEQAESSDALNPDLLQMYPWLEKYSRQASLKADLEEHAAMETDKDPVELPLLDEEVLLETWALLETRRQEWADEEVVRTPDFETFIRGGAHVQATFGIPYDCIISRPCSEVARSWVQGYFATKTAAFAYKRYGEQAAHMLATGWCHKMQYLFDLFVDSQLHEQFVYQDAELDAYVPAPAYIDWILALPLDSPAYKRHEEIKSLRPRSHKASSHNTSSSSSHLG